MPRRYSREFKLSAVKLVTEQGFEPSSNQIAGECRLRFRLTSVPGRYLFRAQVRLPQVAPQAGDAGFDLTGDAKTLDGRVALSRVMHTDLYGPHSFRDDVR